MKLSRRDMLFSSSALLATTAFGDEPKVPKTSLGVIEYAFGARRAADRGKNGNDLIPFLEYLHSIGAGGLQISLGVRTDADAKRLRDRAEALGLYLEGSLRLPRDKADVDRFDAEIRTAKACGATVARPSRSTAGATKPSTHWPCFAISPRARSVRWNSPSPSSRDTIFDSPSKITRTGASTI